MDILKQAEAIRKRTTNKKPENILVTLEDWQLAQPGTRELLIECQRLQKPLEKLYWQAIERRDFETALYSYQAMIATPYLRSISRVLYSESECRHNESDYQERARLWIVRAKGLLGEEMELSS